MNSEYRIIVSRNEYDFGVQVSRMMLDGWEPSGGVNVSHNIGKTHNHTYYSQAMIRALDKGGER